MKLQAHFQQPCSFQNFKQGLASHHLNLQRKSNVCKPLYQQQDAYCGRHSLVILAGVVPFLKKVRRVVAFSADELEGSDNRDGATGAMGVESSRLLYQTIARWSSNFPSVPTAHWSEGGMFRGRRSQEECSPVERDRVYIFLNFSCN